MYLQYYLEFIMNTFLQKKIKNNWEFNCYNLNIILNHIV